MELTRSQRFVEKAHASNRRLYELLRGLLDYGRISSSFVRLVSIDVSRILTNPTYKAQYESVVQERGARLDIRPGLPTVTVDEVALAQALGNLVLNSVKHNDATQPVVVIRPGDIDAGHAEIIVEDNGKGFPDEVRVRFNKIRGSRPSTLKGGFGLIVAHRAVQRMQGEMRLEQADTGGARVRLRLPRG